MIQPLPLRPVPNPRETITSFLARIAAMNGIVAHDFALDIGFSLKRIILLDDPALSRLAEYGGLSKGQLAELVSWTGRSNGDVTKLFRGETFGSRAIWNPVVRGCPVCLREDAETDLRKPLTQMTMRGDWQLREASLCVRHRHPLVPLWEHVTPADRYDFSSRLAEILPDILNRSRERPRWEPSAYDLWLDSRLETGRDETWLGGQSLYAATTFCRLLGTELLRLNQEQAISDEDQWRLAQAMGFDVASRGREAIDEALSALATGHGDEPKKAFGGLYVQLSRYYQNLDAFAPYREILREHILGIWPIAAGQILLGITQRDRKLHSIHSAAKETGIGAILLEQYLINAGAIAHDDDRPVSRRTFDAKTYAALLDKITTLVGPIELRKAIGATRRQLESLIKDRVLVPWTDIATIKSPWRLSDGTDLIDELGGLSVPVAVSDHRWEGIQQAKNRSGLRVGEIIRAVRDGSLQIGRLEDKVGYAQFCVLIAEIDENIRSRHDSADITFVTAAAFARKIGIRAEGWFEELAAAGHTPATHRLHPKLGVMKTYLSEHDADAFHGRFLTPTTMMVEFGEHRQTLLRKLKDAAVMPFKPNGEDYGTLYLRTDIEAVLL